MAAMGLSAPPPDIASVASGDLAMTDERSLPAYVIARSDRDVAISGGGTALRWDASLRNPVFILAKNLNTAAG